MAEMDFEEQDHPYLDAAPASVLVTDCDLDRSGPRIVYVNAAFERMTGWPREEIVGQTPRVLQGRETDHTIFSDMASQLRAGQTWHGETVNYRRDGTPFLVRWSVSPVRDDQGRVSNYLAIQEDVTEQRRCERSYNHMQALVARVVEAAPDGVIVTGADGRIVNVNQGAVALLDWSKDALVGQSFTWIVPGGIAAVQAAADEGTDRPGVSGGQNTGTQGEITAYRRDGTTFPAAVSLVCVGDEGAACHAVFLRDLTARKARENALAMSETRLRNAQRIGRMGGWFYDLATRETELMPEVLYLFGQEAKARNLAHDEVRAWIHPDDLARVAETFRAARATAGQYRCEYRLILADGTVMVVDVIGEPLTDDRGRITGYAGVVQDITERHRVQEELVAARNAAVASSEAKSRFLAMMGHELRTPLNAINGFADLLVNETLGRHVHPAYRDYATHILESGEHLRGIIESVLDVARMENGRITLEEDVICLRDLLKAATNWMTEQADRANLSLEVKDGPPVRLKVDPRLMRQVVSNLVDNAIKFSPAGGRVVIAHKLCVDGSLQIVVSDEGPGIPPEYVNEVTEPFVQVDTRLERKYDGLGLGLHLVQSFMRLHDGRLDIDSAAGVGTRVTAVLPPERVMEMEDLNCALDPDVAVGTDAALVSKSA
ncbi:PAS domain-containing sensor histidine kinase [Rhodovibrio salinarum]|nr:PAS domain-containing sensor histidine kinase [Rhodovibrio salinarum]